MVSLKQNIGKPKKVSFALLVTKTNQNIVFNLSGIKICCDDEVKLLGITIDFKLSFKTLLYIFAKRQEDS